MTFKVFYIGVNDQQYKTNGKKNGKQVLTLTKHY